MYYMRVKNFLPIFLIVACGCKSLENNDSKRPNKVPKDSFWAGGIDGGNWYHIKSINNHRNIARIAVYNDQDGSLIIDKYFMLICDANKYTFIQELKVQISSFDGKNIYFIQSDSVNCYLQPVN